LREIKNARDQRDEAGEIERDDAAGEARERKREEELPGAAQPAERPLPAFFSHLVVGNAVERERRRGAPVIQARIRLRSIKQWPTLPAVAVLLLNSAPRCIIAEAGQPSQLTTPVRAPRESGFLETIADAVQRLDHLEIVVHDLERPA